MTSDNTAGNASEIPHLLSALHAGSPSIRLKAALAIGSSPDHRLIDEVISRCAVETDFYVRDMLTWALTRFPAGLVVSRLLPELSSGVAQARSQALHTLSKIKDPATWSFITKSLLRDPDDEVARSAWRAAVVLVPDAQKADLAEELATQFGRGDRRVQLSLSQALVTLGETVIEPVLRKARESKDRAVQNHTNATERLLRDPSCGHELALNEARRVYVLGRDKATSRRE
jgi:hypothetical protein